MDDLFMLSARLATFERPHHFAKRRASSTKKKVQSTVTWPHEQPSPKALARAGFFYEPSSNTFDNVTCFLCKKSLDGWEAGDNPVREHLNHVPDCGWAINVGIEDAQLDMEKAEEDPHSEKLIAARRDTFRDRWPYEDRKGWKPKIDALVNAGWTFFPGEDADDGTKCHYCNLQLDGWEPKDDPWFEHRKRSADCQFFILVKEFEKVKARSKKGRTRTSTVSKASRLSMQSHRTRLSDAPSVLLGDDEPAEEGDTIMTATSTATRATRTAKKGGKRAAPKRAQPTRAMPGGFVADESEVQEPDNSVASPITEQSLIQPPKSRGKRQASSTVSHSLDDDTSVAPVRKTSMVKAAATEDISEVATRSQVEMPPPPVPSKSTARAARGKKRTSDGLEKLESSAVMVEPAHEVEEAKQYPKPTRKGRNNKKAVEDSVLEEALETSDVPPQPKRAKGRPPKTDKKIEKKVDPPEQPQEEAEPKPKRGRGRPSNASLAQSSVEVPTEAGAEEVQPKRKRGRPSKEAVAKRTSEANLESHVKVTVQVPGKASAAAQASEKVSTDLAKYRQPLHLPSSPQSSDAENHPPSSRPSLAPKTQPTPPQPATRNTQVPLSTSTPRTSPSKRNIITSLSAAQPWTAVDLETIFLPSPSSQQTQPGSRHLDLDSVMKRLTSPERSMSVEDWIMYNAKGAEERLRGECERLIGMFETEGNRALQSLESVQVV